MIVKKKICIISSSRADLGIMKNLIKKLYKLNIIDLVLTGTHLNKKYGNTEKEINDLGLKKYYKLKVPILNKKTMDLVISSKEILKKISLIFEKNKYELLIIYGDRFEILMCAYSATLYNIPIAHLGGGDETVGSYDNQFRNAITKLSHLHFPTNEIAKKRIIKMGENPKLVFNFGSLSLENLKKFKRHSKKFLENKYDFKFLEKNFLVTFHPETLEKKNNQHIDIIIKTLISLKDFLFIFTSSNQDQGGDEINKSILAATKKNNNLIFIKSLGQDMYFNFLLYVDGVIGNSSSGFYEVPSFNKGTLNLGNRQLGRIITPLIVNRDITKNSILEGVNKLIKNNAQNSNSYSNIYFKKNCSNNIIKQIQLFLKNYQNNKKKFY